MDSSDLPDRYQAATDHLSKHDPYLAQIIATYGSCTIEPHTNYYQDLVESIISQQLSVKAAATITGRLKALFAGEVPNPQQIIDTDIQQMRDVGISAQKANYIRDLALHVLDGRIKFDHMLAASNEQIITELADVKGIGEWTAHMFLLFCMGRLNVLAHGDLGIRNGIRKVYDLDHAPSPQEIKDLAKRYNWAPYESIACWYIWRALDNKPMTSN